MSTRRIWCEWAVLDGTARHGVLVGIDGTRFTDVAAGVEPPAGAEQRHGVTVPGLANVHSHVFHRALRHRTHAGRGSFWTWREQMYRLANALTPDLLYRLARATFAEMAVAGVTAVGEFHYLHHPPELHRAVLDAATDAGLRITLLDTLYLHGGLDADGYRPPAAEQQRFVDGSVAEWAQRVEAFEGGPTRRLGTAVHSVRAVDPTAIGAVARWSAGHDAVLHAHVSEQPAENAACLAAHGCTPTELFARCAALGPRFTAVHATHLTDHDVALLGNAGATACFCPSTEADLADGTGPATALRDAGVTLAVGSDSQATIDIVAEARGVELDQRRASGERGHFSAAELLDVATAGGHRALGWDDAGALRVGALADLVTIGLDSVRTTDAPVGALVAATMFAVTAGDVRHVTVGGADVVIDRRHQRVAVLDELGAVMDEIDELVGSGHE